MGAMSEAKPKPKELKDEVSYGALIYNQILNCLRESIGRETYVNIPSRWNVPETYPITSYERYARAIDSLVTLVSVVADQEFKENLKEIEEWAKEAQEEALKENTSQIELLRAYQDLTHEHSQRRFQACLELLRRKGMIIEEVLKGTRI
jgi:Asp-tRNA(Asn)/Glu-tRNA(Gln) amidotransferase A subunit family amidase